ncbi:MAG: hypothetical protein ACFFDP_04885 [Promethearchaeota archaeon]
MTRRRRKDQKRREKRLERLPEKLQRKRERQVTYRIRRMPTWIKFGLVIALVAVIVGGAFVAAIIWTPTESDTETAKADVYFLQHDIFHCNVNNESVVSIDYMEALFGIGFKRAENPLHVIVKDTFDEDHNITVRDFVVYDYFGNAYLLNRTIEPRSITYNMGGISQAMETKRDLGGNAQGYWSLLFGYTLNSSNDVSLAADDLSDMFTFEFSIEMVNNTLIYGNGTIVHCTMLFKTLMPKGSTEYSDGRAYIEFPKTVYNETDGTILANISLFDVERVGAVDGDAKIDNESLIAFEATFTDMSNASRWGFIFDLNVTAWTNNSFCLLDLASPACEFYVQAGYRATPEEVPNQRMHFPNATVDIRTEYENKFLSNYTDIYVSLPQVWVNVSPSNASQPYAGSTVWYRVPTGNYRPLRLNSVSMINHVSSLESPISIEEPCCKTNIVVAVETMDPALTGIRRFLLIY